MGKRKGLPSEHQPDARNIVATYLSATADEIAEGLSWYVDAHKVACEAGDPDRGAGILAALSPQMPWDWNVEAARDVMAGREPRYSTHANRDKARRIDRGEDWRDVLGGSKVRAFATVISDPSDPDAVVIDRHAYDVAVGRVTDDRQRVLYLGRAGTYDTFADAYRQAAAEIGVTPSEVQAVTWTVWRHRKGYDS